MLPALDGVMQILKLTVFVHSAVDFSGQTAVADGASELIVELFGPERKAYQRRRRVTAAQCIRRGRTDRGARGVMDLPDHR
jgi:hypothetical protein